MEATELQAALPRAHYVDASVHSVEREHVLLREWTCAGRLQELGLAVSGELRPGRLALVDLLGESILVTTTLDRQLRAHANVCRHRGSQVVPTEPEGAAPCAIRSLRCPYHSWTYDLDGRLLHAPHSQGLEVSDFSLHPIDAAHWGGFLFLRSEPSTGSLSDALGDIPAKLCRYPLDRLVRGRSLTYDVAANWKVLAENYNECYHCGPVHPELSRLVPAFAGGGSDIDWDGGVPHREGAWTFTLSGTSNREAFPGLDDAERVRHKGELVYPNLLLSLSADHVAAFLLTPLAVDRTRVTCELLFAPAELSRPGFDPSDAAQLWDLVNRQDWAICESVQRGMSSRYYTGGWYAPMEDASLDIKRWLLARWPADV